MKKILSNKNIIIFLIINFILILLFGLFKINNITLLFSSIFVNAFSLFLLKLVFQLLNIKFTKKEKILIISLILFIYIFYFISITTRKFIYYWDYSCYYNIQIALEEAFSTSLFEGIKRFLSSTWSGEYGNFLSFFPEVLFKFTDKSIDSYLISCVIIYIPFIVISFAILIKKLLSLIKIKDESRIFNSILFTFVLFPIVHATFIYGQPDLFGLFFIFMIISLTIDYNFNKLDFIRLFLILIFTFMLIISRRWYMYFVLSYYLCYGVSILLKNIRNKEVLKTIIKNISLYLLIVILFFSITLAPLIKNIIVSNFDYSYYMNGGFFGELTSQFKHLGIAFFFIIVVGIIYGLINKKYRLYSIVSIIEYFLIVFLFTRMQNMGLHHSLLLVPNYIYFIFIFIILIIKYRFTLVIFYIITVCNFSIGVISPKTIFYTDVPLSAPNDINYESIKETSLWLKNNTGNEKVYMIFHNNTFNPDKFRNVLKNDRSLFEKISSGSAIIGVHKFPIELFDYKYIVTVSPFENVSIEWKYNDVFNKEVLKDKFKLINTISTNSSYAILIYERTKNVDLEEINEYKEILKEESNKYPNLYENVIDQYIKDNNL